MQALDRRVASVEDSARLADLFTAANQVGDSFPSVNAVACEFRRQDSCVTRRRRCNMLRKTLLVCGILSSVLYAAMTIVIAMQWEGYSSTSQTISELSAIGAPTRPVWVRLGAVYTVLVTAFGWGIWRAAGTNRALRIVGSVILAYGLLGVLWPFAPMHLREVLAAGGGTRSDTMHLVLASVTVLLMLLAIGCAASAFGKPFRRYSIATLAILA